MNSNRVSSTLIRQFLAHDNLEEANQFIGSPYSISGKVIHGEKRGREIGFPTIGMTSAVSSIHCSYSSRTP